MFAANLLATVASRLDLGTTSSPGPGWLQGVHLCSLPHRSYALLADRRPLARTVFSVSKSHVAVVSFQFVNLPYGWQTMSFMHGTKCELYRGTIVVGHDGRGGKGRREKKRDGRGDGSE